MCPNCSGSNITIVRSGGNFLSLPESVLAILTVVGIIIFIALAPVILMVAGGAAGFKAGEFLTGQSVERFAERSDGKGFKRIGFSILLSIVLAIFGFYGGFKISDSIMSDKPNTQQIPKDPKEDKISKQSNTELDLNNSAEKANKSDTIKENTNKGSQAKDLIETTSNDNQSSNNGHIDEEDTKQPEQKSQKEMVKPPTFLGVGMVTNSKGTRYMTNLSYFDFNGKIETAYPHARIGDSGYTIKKFDIGPVPQRQPNDPDYFSVGEIWIENDETKQITKFTLKPYN